MNEIRLTKEDLERLAAPIPKDAIRIKVQTNPGERGYALCVAYIDARAVMDRLDDVAEGDWWDEYHRSEIGGLECALTVKGVTRRDVGVPDPDTSELEKSAYSDALKRAAVKFGVGRFLYNLPKLWGKVEQSGRGYRLPDTEEERLLAVISNALDGKLTPDTTPPSGDGSPPPKYVNEPLARQQPINPRKRGKIKVTTPDGSEVEIPANIAPSIRAVVEFGLAKTIADATKLLNTLNLPGADIETVKEVVGAYHNWGMAGKSPEEAVELTLAGERA